MRKGSGFTLIELMVVISIIGLISSIALASLQQAREKAKIARAKAELHQILEAIIHSQGEAGRVLDQIIDSPHTNQTLYCTDCPCRHSPPYNGPLDIRGDVGVCYDQWVTALTRLEQSGGGVFGLSHFNRDPWGSPYLVDQNEDEHPDGGPGGCTHDTLRSAGPDGIVGEWVSGNLTSTDDIEFTVPYSRVHTVCPN